MAYRWYCQWCGAEEHGFPTQELAEFGADCHECGPRKPNMTHPPALYMSIDEEEPDGKGGWQETQNASAERNGNDDAS